MLKKKRIIADEIDLTQKSVATDDSFFGSGKIRALDSSVGKIYKGEKRFFALLSTSDKEINCRIYNKDSWKDTVMDGSWSGSPYAKPMIRNHDIRNEIPFGRIKDSFFVEHETFDTCNMKNEKLDSKVLDYFKKQNMLNEGSGSVIVEFTSDETTADRMIAGLDVTVSQSSYFEKANCSVCGNDYFGEHCTHVAGENYTIKKDEIEVDVKCVANVSGFSPIELSIVNTPANDTSVIYVLDASITTPSSDSSEESKIDDIENKCKDNVDDKTKPTEDKDRMFKEMLKDTLTQNIKKDISDNAELLKAFGDLFDASTEDQMPLVKTLMDEIAKVVETVKLETVVDSSAEEEVAEEVKPVEDAVHAEEEVAEDEAEKHVEEVSVEDEATDEKSVEDKIKDALGVIKKEKTTKDNKVLNTLIKGLKL